MCSALDDYVPFETFCSVAARLGENIGSYTTQLAASKAAPDSAIVCNILHAINAHVLTRTGMKPNLKHQLRKTGGEIVLTVNYVPSLTEADVIAIRRVSARIGAIQFVFRELDTAEPLAYGRLLVVVLAPAAKLTSVALSESYAPPLTRRARTAEVDWTDSIVVPNDRPLVLEVIDDVYNMSEFMPVDMWVSIEPIENTDYRAATPHQKRAQTTAADKHKANGADDENNDDDDNTSTETATSGTTVSATRSADLVGYGIHFVGISSFTDAFPAYLRRKYQTRWIGYAVLFPQIRERRSGVTVVLQRLVIMLSGETTLVGTADAHALIGAKRLCQKMVPSKSKQTQ